MVLFFFFGKEKFIREGGSVWLPFYFYVEHMKHTKKLKSNERKNKSFFCCCFCSTVYNINTLETSANFTQTNIQQYTYIQYTYPCFRYFYLEKKKLNRDCRSVKDVKEKTVLKFWKCKARVCCLNYKSSKKLLKHLSRCRSHSYKCQLYTVWSAAVSTAAAKAAKSNRLIQQQ